MGAGAAVALTDGTEVGAAGMGVAVADEPQANIAANSRAKGPRTMILGFFNQWFKWDKPPIYFLGIVVSHCPRQPICDDRGQFDLP